MSDRIIYEAEPIPPTDPNESRSRRRAAILGAGGLVVALLLGVTFGATVFRGDDEPDLTSDPDRTASSVVTTIPASPFSRDTSPTTLSNESATSQLRADSGAYRAAPRRPDVATPTPALPQRTLTWEEVTLDVPAGTDVYIQSIHPFGDGFIALGSGYGPDGQSVILWESPDGSTWARKELTGDFTNASIWQVQFGENGAIALGEVFADVPLEVEGEEVLFYDDGFYSQATVWTSPDGSTWTRSDLELGDDSGTYGYLNTAVVGPRGYLVLGNEESSPEFGPVVLELDGYRLELNERTFTYLLFAGSGEQVASGSMDEFYNYSETEDGQAVRHPETGELLTVIPWEEWEMAYADAYEANGPFGGFSYNPPTVVIEKDGYRLTVDEESLTYTVEDVSSGEVLGTGDMNDFWRGPEPVIRDADGNVLLTVDWATYDAAYEEYWSSTEGETAAYNQQLVAFHSVDGVTWTRATINAGQRNLYFNSVIGTDDGYLAFGESYDESGGGPQTWTSSDGLSWERAADLPPGIWLWGVTRTADGTLIGLGEGSQGSALWSSTDGIAWSEALGTRIPEDINSYEWFNQVASGRLGTVVIGNRSTDYYAEEPGADPLTLTQQEHTLTFDDWNWPPRVTVVDNVTGDVVIDVELGEEGLPEGFFYEDGVTIIENNDRVLMVITDEEWDAAMEARWSQFDELAYAYEEPTPTMYFSTDLDQWEEVPIAQVFRGYINQVAVGAEVIVLSAQAPEVYAELEDDGSSPEERFVQPSPLLLIGRP